MEPFHHFGTVCVKEDRKTGKVVQKPCLLIAKFHYTDTDTDTDFFAAKLRWVRAGPCRVRVVEFSF